MTPTLLPTLLAWRPFLDPIPIVTDRFWLLMLIPLVAAIAIVYKTIKLDDLSKLPRQATVLTVQIVFYMVLAAAAIWLIAEWA